MFIFINTLMRIHRSGLNSVVTNQSYKKRKICEVFERRDILPQPLHREYLLYKKWIMNAHFVNAIPSNG